MTREVFISQVEREQEALRGFLLALCCGNKDDADDFAQGCYRASQAVDSLIRSGLEKTQQDFN